MRARSWIVFTASMVMGLIFVSSGIGKIMGQSAFLLSMSNLTFFPHPLVVFIADVLPWGELALGILLLAGVFTQIVSFASCILVACFIFQNTWMIMHGMKNEPCSCFGALERIFEGRFSTLNALYIDIAMMVLSLLIYFAYRGKLLNWRPWAILYRNRASPVTGSPAINGDIP